MPRITRPLVAVLLCLAALATVSPAIAKNRPGISPQRDRALDLYAQCWKIMKADCGRDKVDDGFVGKKGKVYKMSLVQTVNWSHRLHAAIQLALHPPVVQQAPVATDVSESVAPAPAPSVAPSTASSGTLPTCTWQPESGGDWHVQSVFSGGGYYGIIQSSWDAYGGGQYADAPYDASPAAQTAIAQKIWDDAGPAAWANC